MDKTLSDLISLGLDQIGYKEKATCEYLDYNDKNSGYANFTKYSRDINNAGLMGCQGQPWCCSFQFYLDLKTFGKEQALKLWNMTNETYVGYNCFATLNAFKKVGKVGKTPKLGALVIFTYSHAGRVVKMYAKNGVKYFDCLEGNTSSTVLNERNGGCVAIKTRRIDDSTVKGFCYIDYDSIENTENQELSGWVKTDNGWMFYLGDTHKPITNAWYMDSNGKWVFFNGASIAESNTWIKYNGLWYYLGSDCYCLESTWIEYKGNWYYLTADGSMAVNSYIKSKDAGNDLYYFVDADGIWQTGKSVIHPKDYPIVI